MKYLILLLLLSACAHKKIIASNCLPVVEEECQETGIWVCDEGAK